MRRAWSAARSAKSARHRSGSSGADRRARRPAAPRRSPWEGSPPRACARAAHGRDREVAVGAISATGIRRCAGSRTPSSIDRLTPTSLSARSANGSRQIASTVSAATSASRSVRACCCRPPRPRRGLGVAEVEVARDAQGSSAAIALPAPRRRARRRSGSSRVGAPVEDDGQRIGERQAVDLERDRDGRLGIDERAPQEVVGVVLVTAVLLVHRSLPWSGPHSTSIGEGCTTEVPMIISTTAETGRQCVQAPRHHRPREVSMKILYKPFGLILGLFAGFVSQAVQRRVGALRRGRRSRRRSRPCGRRSSPPRRSRA